jgi:hypothetical protein
MKIAAGCFACLTLIFLGLSVVLTFAMASVVSMLSAIDPDLAMSVSPMLGYVNWGTNGCCCLSGVVAVVLFAVGMSRGNNEAAE